MAEARKAGVIVPATVMCEPAPALMLPVTVLPDMTSACRPVPAEKAVPFLPLPVETSEAPLLTVRLALLPTTKVVGATPKLSLEVTLAFCCRTTETLFAEGLLLMLADEVVTPVQVMAAPLLTVPGRVVPSDDEQC